MVASISLSGIAQTAAPQPNNLNLVLVTLDGVRWQEFFGRPDARLLPIGDVDRGLNFPGFRRVLQPQGIVFGEPGHDQGMWVSNDFVSSLPAYTSIFSGRTEQCYANEVCSRLSQPSFLERISTELNFSRDDIGVFASWEGIARAVEQQSGRMRVNAGLQAMDDDVRSMADPGFRIVNELQFSMIPSWHDARFDEYTIEMALAYLRIHRPRILYLALNDSDDIGHLHDGSGESEELRRRDYRRYVDQLRTYDHWLLRVSRVLEELGDYGRRTALIVTTDHGRGDGGKWVIHNLTTPEAARVWMYLRLPQAGSARFRVLHSADQAYEHLDIRPTIETLFGLSPLRMRGSGKSLLRSIIGSD